MTTPEAFPNADLLWSPQQLHERLGDENLVILDTRATHQVLRGIIPGAAHFDLYGLGLTRTSIPDSTRLPTRKRRSPEKASPSRLFTMP